MTTKPLRRRAAFTLVEMLVASALIIFMMYVIASAFERGLESFRVLRAQGDMQEKLRAAATALRIDLTAQHFSDGTGQSNDVHLSDQRLNDQNWKPPQNGYFRISMPGTTATSFPVPPGSGQFYPGVLEGLDPDGPGAGPNS